MSLIIFIFLFVRQWRTRQEQAVIIHFQKGTEMLLDEIDGLEYSLSSCSMENTCLEFENRGLKLKIERLEKENEALEQELKKFKRGIELTGLVLKEVHKAFIKK